MDRIWTWHTSPNNQSSNDRLPSRVRPAMPSYATNKTLRATVDGAEAIHLPRCPRRSHGLGHERGMGSVLPSASASVGVSKKRKISPLE